ncbi:MAG: S-layer homology domain-containing protein [Clostridia bacterium]|nr:S-layer homology domain-containing protein [Clostridia bacterium]
MKRIRLILLTFIAVVSASAGASAYSDVFPYDDYCQAVNRLGDLNIINGYEDGSFRPSDCVTREEFAKMIVCAMDKASDAAAMGSYTCKFSDVADGHWSIPYVNYISGQEIMKGYVDGTFGASKNINYAEASTILCRLLGYTEDNVGYFWPSNYVSKADALGFNFGAADIYAPLNRAVISKMLDAALFSDVNPNAQPTPVFTYAKDSTFLAAAGYTVVEDAVILATAADDDTLKTGEIKLSNDTIYLTKTQAETYESASLIKYAVVNDDGDIIAVKDNLKGAGAAAELDRLGYTALANCHIISTSSSDKTLSSDQIRTNYGVYKSDVPGLSGCVGEVGTLLLNKEKRIISASTSDAAYSEYIVAEVNGSTIKYVYENNLITLDIPEDYPIYVDGGAKKNYSQAIDEFTAGSNLIFYTADGVKNDFAVLDKNSEYTVLNDCFIIASKNEDKTIGSDQVRTSGGTYKVRDSSVLSMAGSMGTVVLDGDNRIYSFAATDLYSMSVGVSNVSGNEIEYITTNGEKGTIKLDSGFETYVDYTKSTFAVSKSSITSGTDLTFYGTARGSWEFVVVDTINEITPVLASRDYTESDTSLEGTAIDKENLIVYRNGTSAALSDIRTNDVVYYNTKTNIMDVYNKKVTGIYYAASPSKAYVTSVTVGGKEYEIGSISATNMLDASPGAFDIGDKVTLLLGKNDKVVFAASISGFNAGDYGVLLSTSTRVKESGDDAGKTEYVASLLMSDGDTYEYVTDKNYKDYKGSLVKLTYTNSQISLTKITKNSSVYGELDPSKMTIGKYTLSDDIVIFQLISNDDNNEAKAEVLDIKVLPVKSLSADRVLNAVTANSFGDIGLLFVEELTDSSYEYGILTSTVKPSGDSTTTTYNITADGSKGSYISDSYMSANVGPVKFRTENGKVVKISSLYQYGSASAIDAIDGTRIKLGSSIYSIASNVIVYQKKDINTYELLGFDELEHTAVKSVTVYSDVTKSQNGDIKVIVITR